MRKSRFANLFLTGKVATLPLLIGQIRAEVTPTVSDLVTSDLRVIEIPVIGDASAPGIRLQSVAADSNYGPSSYAAFFCTNGLPATATIVVTGVNQSDVVVLAGARNKNDSFHLAIDNRLTIGTQGLTILGSASLGSGIAAPALAPVQGIVNFNVNTANLTALAAGGRFYLQAAVIPAGNLSVSSWRISELDEILVGNCAISAYGMSIY